jgi:acyl-CoA reductase-like NAD-dependent aldehyde dehydrogenase
MPMPELSRSKSSERPLREGLRELSAKGSIECYEPATRRPLGSVCVTTADEVKRKVESARRAQESWAKTSFQERQRVLGIMLERLLAQADELVEAVVRDSGKTRHNAMVGEIWPVAEKLRWTIAHGEKHLVPERVSSGLFVHKRAQVEFAPLGVIGVIAPWNYPLQNLLGPTIPALMAGNAVVLKASEWVAWSSERFQAFFDGVFKQAGYPKELVQVVQGHADTGAALVSSGVDKIIFTGSLENGKRVLAQAAATLTPVVLELGGKDPLIVCDDAHLEQAAHAALAGTFINCGQNCLASERILVMDAVYGAFEARVVELTRGLRQGDPLGNMPVDLGAIVSPLQLELIEELVNDAVAQGAKVLTGGKRVHAEQGQFFAPTILANVSPEMRIAREETFGPIMLLMRVQNEREAMSLANGTAFGLGATVLTKSKARAERITRALVAGQVSVNDFGLTYMAMDLPFGGVRGSGFGRLNGREGLRACTNPKAVLKDRFPLHVPAKVFPVGERGAEVAREVLRVIYEPGLTKRADAVLKLVRILAGGA